MNSILTNTQALSALQALNMTQQDLNITQNQVATGLAVSTAADNAAYWAIGTQLTSDSGIITAANTALAQSQSILDTATSALNSVITTIDAIQAQITSASNPGASLTDINSTLASLSAALTQSVNGASFNGVNLLNNTQATALTLVSGYDGTAQGGSIATIAFSSQALTGAQNTAATALPAVTGTVTDPALITLLNGYTVSGAGTVAGTAVGATSAWSAGGAGTVTITSTDAAGDSTVSTYTGTSPSGAAATTTGAYSPTNLTGSSDWTVSTVETTAASAKGLLVQLGTESIQGTYDLTTLGTGGTAVTALNATDMLGAVNAALSAVKSYASSIGEAQDQITTSTTFNTALSTDYTTGLSALVDADMNIASTRLQALQTQEQLGIQSLSIANQNSQLILKLFPG
jgi:flagellin